MLAVDSLRASQSRLCRALLVVSMFLFWSPGLVEAQAPQPKKPSAAFGEEMEVSEVLLDVLVTDEDGNVVFGLGPNDFIIEEDGNELAPESVTFYSNRRFLEMAAPEGVSVDRVPEDRYFVVLLYNPPTADSRSSQLFFRLADASRRAARWAYEELLPNDWVAVMSYDSGLRLHQDFTTDRKAIDRALRRAAAGKKPEGQWKSRSGSEGGGPSLEQLPVDKELMQSTPTIYAGLTVLAEALGELRGRKNLIFFGMDFPSQLSAVAGPTDPVRYPPMMQELNASNVAVHTIALANRVDQETLYQLADDTGGIHDWNFPDFSVPLRGIAQQNNGYYLLSYRSAHPRDDSGYQEVEIRTVNPEFEVLARGGYLYGR